MAVVLYLVITTFVVQTYQVQQVSMLDTLRDGQHLLIDKLTPRFDDYSRGDIIVFHPPRGSVHAATAVTSRISSASSALVATTSRYVTVPSG